MTVPVNAIPNLQRTNASVAISPNAGADIGQAVQSLGQSFGSVSDAAQQWSNDREQGLYVGEAAAMDKALSDGFDEYQQEARVTGDESKWVEGWGTRSARIKEESLKNSKLKDKTKVLLGSQFDNANKANTEKIYKESRKREMGKATAQLIDAGETDLQNGDYTAYEKKIRAGVKVGLIGAEEGERALIKGHAEVDKHEAAALIELDPDLAEELLKDFGNNREFKNLSTDSRKSLLGSARKRGQVDQTDRFNDLSLNAIQGKLLPVEEIVAMGRDGRLTAGQSVNYVRAHYGAQAKPFDSKSFADLRMAISQYDPDNDEFGYAHGDLTAEIMIQPKSVQARLNTQLQSSFDEEEAKKVKGPVDSALKELARLHKGDFFANASSQFGIQKPLNKDQEKESSNNYLNAYDTVERLAKQFPNLTSSELLTKALKEPENVDVLIQQSNAIQAGLKSVEPTDIEAEATMNKFRFNLLSRDFPSISPELTVKEAIQKASVDAGGSLTVQQIKDIKRLYR